MATWVMGGIVAVMIPIYTSTANINSLSIIVRVIMAGILRPISYSNINSKMINRGVYHSNADGRGGYRS